MRSSVNCHCFVLHSRNRGRQRVARFKMSLNSASTVDVASSGVEIVRYEYDIVKTIA
jgi:hypothetical protein